MHKNILQRTSTLLFMPALIETRDVTTRLRDSAADLVGLLTTPLLPADYVDLVSPLRAGAQLRGRIIEIHPENDLVFLLRHGAQIGDSP